jgi:AraC-like DNA-binding protein
MLTDEEIGKVINDFQERRLWFSERMNNARSGKSEHKLMDALHGELGISSEDTRAIVMWIIENNYEMAAPLVLVLSREVLSVTWDALCIGIVLGKKVQQVTDNPTLYQHPRTITPGKLASEIGISPKTLRQYLRDHHEEACKHVKNKNWQVPEEIADAARLHFHKA